MSIEYTIYTKATGQILESGVGPASAVTEYDTVDNGVVVGFGNKDADYVLAGVITPRPTVAPTIDKTIIQADGLDEVTIVGIPTGWTYTLSNGATGSTNGTNVVLVALEVGTFTAQFSLWPYQSVEYTINAIATAL